MIPRPATWPRWPGLIRVSEPRRCPGPSPATRPCPARWPPRPKPGWRWLAPCSTSVILTRPGSGWRNWPPMTRPTGASRGPPACASSLSATPARHAGRSTRCTTGCPARWRPSWRWPSRPSSQVMPRRPAVTSGSSGRWIAPISAPRSAWREPAWRQATDPARSRRWRRYRVSVHHAAAQIAAVRILVSAGVTGDDLKQAGGRLGLMRLDEARRQQLSVEILRAALDSASSGQAPASPRAAASGAASGDELILGCEPNERALRLGLERGYRALARLTPDHGRRIELVGHGQRDPAHDLGLSGRAHRHYPALTWRWLRGGERWPGRRAGRACRQPGRRGRW